MSSQIYTTAEGTQMTAEQVRNTAQMFKSFSERADNNVNGFLFGLAGAVCWDLSRALDRIRLLNERLEAEKRKATDAIVTPIADAAAASCIKSGEFLGNLGSFEVRRADP